MSLNANKDIALFFCHGTKFVEKKIETDYFSFCSKDKLRRRSIDHISVVDFFYFKFKGIAPRYFYLYFYHQTDPSGTRIHGLK